MKKICIVVLVLFFAAALYCIQTNKKLHAVKASREEAFISLFYSLKSIESDYKENGDKSPRNFADLIRIYSGMGEDEYYKLVYGAEYDHLSFPKIIYIPNIKLYESFDYSISLFQSDRLEISVRDSKLRWVESKKEVDVDRK